MFSTVKSVAVASVIVVVSIQPGADAARAPYSARPEALNGQFASTIFNPYADPMGSVLRSRGVALEGLPLSFNWGPPVAMVTPEPIKPESLPQYPAIEPFNTEPPVVEPAVPAPQQAQPVAPPAADVDKVPLASAPDADAHEAFVGPQVPVPQVRPRNEPSHRRAARPPMRADVIAFAGPAGAPFAHTRFCLKYPGECRVRKMQFRGGAINLTAARRQELVRVNAEVNRSIIGTPMNEPVAQEQWVISPKIGDCNDYAVTKRHKLIASGWPARALLLAEVVTTWGEHHLVLVVRTRQGDIVADNLNANLRNWTKTPYEWVRVESPVNPLFWSKIKTPQPDVVAMNGARKPL